MRFADGWQFITDTWHETLDEAFRQAEFEYEGVSGTWQAPPNLAVNIGVRPQVGDWGAS